MILRKATAPVIVGVAIMIIVAVLSLVSCNSDTDGGQITVTDALGREVTVDKNPTRVAALLGSFADVWRLSGGELCAVTDDALTDFGIDDDGLAMIGGAHSPNAEGVIASGAELVLASANTASHVEVGELFESIGITVIYFDVVGFGDYLRMLKICTDITGRGDLYEKNGLRIEAEIESIKKSLRDEQVDKRVLLLRASSSTVKAKGSKGTVLGEMLADLGCTNIADGDSTLLENLSVEAVIRNEPYRIFAVTMGDDTEAAINALKNTLEENPAWGSLDAVKEERVHVMDKSLFNVKPNARWGEAYRILYEILIDE